MSLMDWGTLLISIFGFCILFSGMWQAIQSLITKAVAKGVTQGLKDYRLDRAIERKKIVVSR